MNSSSQLKNSPEDKKEVTEDTPLIMKSRDSTLSDHSSNNSDDSYRGDFSLQESESEERGHNQELVWLVAVAAATAATLGYDVGIMAAAIQPMEAQMNLTGVQKELAMGSLNFTAAIGALVGGRVADKKGRKATIQLCSWIFVVGTLLMSFAPRYDWLLLGRIVTGMGVGVSFVVAPVFISEVAPSSQRGQLNTVFDVAINGGILLGYVLGFLVQVMPFIVDELKWRIMLALGLILPAVVLRCLAALPESPRWLMLVQQEPAAAQVLQRLGHSNVDATIDAIRKELQEERELQQQFNTANSSSWWKLSSPGQRLAVGLGFWQQVTGTEAVLYYSADFLLRAGLDSPTKRLFGNCFVGICKLVPELIAMQYVDVLGRKPLILGSAVALMVATGSLSLALYWSLSPRIVIALLCAIMAAFSSGLGPLTFLVVSENLALSERAHGMTLGAAINRCTSGAVALTAVSLSSALGDSGFFAFYACVGAVSLLFYRNLPETSGLSLEALSAQRRLQRRQQHQQLSTNENFEQHHEAVELQGQMA